MKQAKKKKVLEQKGRWLDFSFFFCAFFTTAKKGK
jgi:hypothetical protein